VPGSFIPRQLMTSLNLNQIPSEIDTVERLAAWCSMVLMATSGAEEVNEVSGVAVPAIEAIPINAPAGTFRYVSRFSLPLAEAHLYDVSKKPWMHIGEISRTNTFPTPFARPVA
jgi:hypothetical protein